MLIVKIKNNDINRALKEYKSKVIKTRQMTKLNELREFVKPSVKNRSDRDRAKYNQKRHGKG